MQIASLIIAFAAFGTGLKAAYDWYRSSQIVVIPTWAIDGGIEPVEGTGSQMGWLAGVIDAGTRSAALNKSAALWTGATVILSAGAGVAGALGALG